MDDGNSGAPRPAAPSFEAERLWIETRRLALLAPHDRSDIDQNAVIDSICAAARNVTQAQGACVVLREGELVHYAREDTLVPLWAGQKFPIAHCISGWSITHNERVVIEDIYSDSRIPIEYYRSTYVKSLAMQPIASSEAIGAIGVYWSNRHAATEHQLDLLERIADVAALVITNLRLRVALEEAQSARTGEAPRTYEVHTPREALIDGPLLWKFIPVPTPDQLICWVWQAWTQGGHLHARADRNFDTFSACEDDARAHGYVQPEKRL